MSEALGFGSNNKIYHLNNKFVCLYRIKNTNSFAIAYDDFNNMSEKNKKITENILKNIKRKNPKFDFYNVNKYNVETNMFPPVSLNITEPIIKTKPNIFNRIKNFIKNESFENSTSIQDVKDKVEEELSKYMEISTTEDFKEDSDLKDFFHDNYVKSNNIFLLSEDYGAKISSIIKLRYNGYIIKINSIKINRNNNKFKYGNLFENYNSSDVRHGSIEDFIKKFVDKLIKTNEIRIKNRESAKLKRNTKKFNL